MAVTTPARRLPPLIRRENVHSIEKQKRRGASILPVEQNDRAALQVADFADVPEAGEIALEGPARELANDKRVIESYLGLGGRR